MTLIKLEEFARRFLDVKQIEKETIRSFHKMLDMNSDVLQELNDILKGNMYTENYAGISFFLFRPDGGFPFMRSRLSLEVDNFRIAWYELEYDLNGESIDDSFYFSN